VSVEFLILKYPIVEGEPESLGTVDEVSANLQRSMGIVVTKSGMIAGADWEIEYSMHVEDDLVTMLKCKPSSSCTRRKPQLLGDWMDALRSIASALDAVVLDAQLGVPIGPNDDDDVPAPEQTEDFVIELMPTAGPNGSLGEAPEIWRDLERRFGMTQLKPTIASESEGWRLRVFGATEGPMRRLELHLAWTNIDARTALLKRCASINDGDWLALDPARGDVFPLDWFLD
jgi:hypothetical protein